MIGRWFAVLAAGAELPVVWSIMLILGALLGDGPHDVGSQSRFR